MTDFTTHERKAVMAFIRNIFLAGFGLGALVALLLDRL